MKITRPGLLDFDLFITLLTLLVVVMLIGGSTRLLHTRAVGRPNPAPSVAAPVDSTSAPRIAS